MTIANEREATLLVVDDDPDIRDILQLLLETDGYHVVTASDGQDALEKIEAGLRPSLILLDLMMPRMDGEEFLKVLRSRSEPLIPVIIMSGHAAGRESPDLAACVRLAKPLNLSDLMDLVHRIVSDHHGEPEREERPFWEIAAGSGPPP